MKGIGLELITNSEEGFLGDLRIKPQLDDEGLIVSGMSVADVTNQNCALILMYNPGELKEYPVLGVGLNDALLGEDLLEYRHKVRSNFAQDGLNIIELNLYQLENISIKAKY